MIHASHAATHALMGELRRQLGGTGVHHDALVTPPLVPDRAQPPVGPLEHLESIARGQGLACWLRRMRVADAVWLAATETPIVAWDARRVAQFRAGPCGSKMNFSVFQSPSGVSGSRLPCALVVTSRFRAHSAWPSAKSR